MLPRLSIPTRIQNPTGFAQSRAEEHLVAFIEIAFISILSRRLVRLVNQQISA
jgi:hypothetical protein